MQSSTGRIILIPMFSFYFCPFRTVCNIVWVRSNPMPPCNHEEADTRIVIHVLHALQSGRTSVLIRTVDTDVVVILVGKFDRLIAERSDADIWIAFGMGKHFHFISVNRVCFSLGETRGPFLERPENFSEESVAGPSCSFSGGSFYSTGQRTHVLAKRARVEPPQKTPEITSKESCGKDGKNKGGER